MPRRSDGFGEYRQFGSFESDRDSARDYNRIGLIRFGGRSKNTY
jgi:hypothetical protein